jgi:GAF domain-containing protein
MSTLDEPSTTHVVVPLHRASGRRGARPAVEAEPRPTRSADATSDLTDVVARASGRMLPEATLGFLLDLVTSTAVQVVPAACGAGVTVTAATGEPGTRYVTAAGTDRLVELLDARQYELSEGPCLTAWSQRAVVRVDDLTSEERWPRWSAEACHLGARSVLSAPLVAGDRAMGALKLYSHVPAAFGAADERAAAMFAAQAAVVVRAAVEVRRAGHLDADLQKALRRRELVSQATGIVMGRDRVSAAGALAHLVAVARRDGRSVHEVAQRLISTTTRGR